MLWIYLGAGAAVLLLMAVSFSWGYSHGSPRVVDHHIFDDRPVVPHPAPR